MKYFSTILILFIVLFFSSCKEPAQEPSKIEVVSFSPTQPRLGDTLTIKINQNVEDISLVYQNSPYHAFKFSKDKISNSLKVYIDLYLLGKKTISIKSNKHLNSYEFDFAKPLTPIIDSIVPTNIINILFSNTYTLFGKNFTFDSKLVQFSKGFTCVSSFPDKIVFKQDYSIAFNPLISSTFNSQMSVSIGDTSNKSNTYPFVAISDYIELTNNSFYPFGHTIFPFTEISVKRSRFRSDNGLLIDGKKMNYLYTDHPIEVYRMVGNISPGKYLVRGTHTSNNYLISTLTPNMDTIQVLESPTYFQFDTTLNYTKSGNMTISVSENLIYFRQDFDIFVETNGVVKKIESSSFFDKVIGNGAIVKSFKFTFALPSSLNIGTNSVRFYYKSNRLPFDSNILDIKNKYSSTLLIKN